MTTAEAILSFLKSRPGNEPTCAKQLLHLGSRAAVDQALSRLVGRRKIIRVARGFYALPVSTRFGAMAPGSDQVIAAIARQKGERIAPSGATVANAMGLTTQVPLRRIYLTSGRSRRLNLSGEMVEMHHAAPLAEDARHERVLRAIEWLGPDGLEQARAVLNTLPLKDRRKLAERAALMRGWMAKLIGESAYNTPPETAAP